MQYDMNQLDPTDYRQSFFTIMVNEFAFLGQEYGFEYVGARTEKGDYPGQFHDYDVYFNPETGTEVHVCHKQGGLPAVRLVYDSNTSHKRYFRLEQLNDPEYKSFWNTFYLNRMNMNDREKRENYLENGLYVIREMLRIQAGIIRKRPGLLNGETGFSP